MLRSNREMRNAFQALFRDLFACCPDLQLQAFRSYLVDFPCSGAVEAACCEDVITECKARDALKQVGLNKSPELEAAGHVCAYSD